MSRIGRQPVPLASGVEVKLDDGRLVVKGPRGTLEQNLVPWVSLQINGEEVTVQREAEHKRARAMHGLMRSLLANMVQGVTTGFTRELEIVGVGYRAEVRGRELVLNVGYSHPVVMKVPDDLEARADSPTRIAISGSDKQRVGQFASDVREVRPPEPYKGKGIRYMGEEIRRKVGKSGVGK